MRSSGSGAAMSHTKSHSPRSHTLSMISLQITRIRASCSATRFGVNPWYTSDRRRWCSGLSMLIIIGSGIPCGRGPP